MIKLDRRADRKLVSNLLGRELKRSEIVHHCPDGALVVCENQAYHLLLHKRARALKACGDKNWLKCHYCGEYDEPNNLCFRGCHIFHRECSKEYSRQYRLSHPNRISDKTAQLLAINDFLVELRE